MWRDVKSEILGVAPNTILNEILLCLRGIVRSHVIFNGFDSLKLVKTRENYGICAAP